MHDEFADQRLPDLPTDGYATRREKQLTDEIMFYIRDVERDRISLLDTVTRGRERFRRIAKKAWRHLKCDDALADSVFGYLVLLAGTNPELQLQTLRDIDTAKRTRIPLWLPATTT